MAKVLILIFLALSIRANCTQLIEYCRKPPALFVFGDSFFDPGNNNYIKTTTLDQANFWPYGETYFKYPTGRFSDGRLISDFIGIYLIFFFLSYELFIWTECEIKWASWWQLNMQNCHWFLHICSQEIMTKFTVGQTLHQLEQGFCQKLFKERYVFFWISCKRQFLPCASKDENIEQYMRI